MKSSSLENRSLSLTLFVQKSGIRVDVAILKALLQEGKTEISRALLKKCFRNQEVLWRGAPVKASQILPQGRHELIILSSTLENEIQPAAAPASAEFSLPIVYEDESIFVLHKPSGIPSAALRSTETRTAVNFAISKFSEIARIGRSTQGKFKALEPGLLHRLDTQTSGLLAFAKTQSEFDRLIAAWKNHKIGKFYRALVQIQNSPSGRLKNPLPETFPFTLDFPIAHHPHSSKKMVALTRPHTQYQGKPLRALTHILSYRRCSPHVAPICESEICPLIDFELKLETGVMHQIRCHLASQGWPILGDSVYKGASSRRLWLHAWKLALPLQSGTLLELEAALPDGWPAFQESN